MRLRHKKPLNPYKGQTNNDKSEFNDDDFRQQGSPHKKNGISSTDQIYKYAKILSKFIKTINQDVKELELPAPSTQLPTPAHHQQVRTSHEELSDRRTHPAKRQEIKQLKQNAKIQSKIQHREDLKEPKNYSKKKEIPVPTNNFKETKNLPQEAVNLNSSASGTNLQQLKNSQQNKNKKNETSNINGVTPEGLLSNQPGMNLTTLTGTSPNINFQNNLPNYMSGVPGVMHPTQLMQNLNFSGLNQAQIMQYMMRAYPNLMYSGVPMGLNMSMMGMGVPAGQSFAFNQMPKFAIKPAQNLFTEQVKTFKSQQESEIKNLKTVFPLKRSAYHVAIAYKIYLDKLKKEGHNFQNLQEIDPTRNARRIKSNSQSTSQNKTDKNGLKKKK